MRAGEDKDRLIRVRQQDLLIFPLRSWIQADNGARSFFDFFDHPAFIGQERDPHAIANRSDVAQSTAFVSSRAA